MTEIEAYQEYIRCKHNAFCKAVIRSRRHRDIILTAAAEVGTGSFP